MSLQPNDTNSSEPKTNGYDQTPKSEAPQPAPRRLNSQTEPLPVLQQNNVNHKTQNSESAQNSTATAKSNDHSAGQNHKKATPSSSLEGDDNQVLPRPITNEEFQAMIPAHFLNKPSSTSEPSHAVTVVIHKPDPIDLPPPPTGPGRVTETITKSTFTETVVTRITDNNLVVPVIIEV